MTAATATAVLHERRRAAAAVRLLATLAALAGGQAVLWLAGAALPRIPLDRAGAAQVFAEADPVALAVAAIRFVALIAGGGLLAVTALGVAARCGGAARLVIHLDRWTPPSMRRLLDGAIGVGLAASVGLSVAPAGADAGEEPPTAATTIQRLPDAPATTLRRMPDAPAPQVTPPGLSLRRLPDAAPSAPPPADPAPPDPASGRSPAPPPAAATRPSGSAKSTDPASTATAPSLAPASAAPSALAAPAPSQDATPAPDQIEVVVQPGESFWRLAEQHEARRLGRHPTEAEIGACWQELVAVNRHRLAVPDDPDLLFPGQRLILPCP